MKITFIHHSSFLVETTSAYLLFDYFEGEIPPLDANKPLYVFASHRHGDHFSPIIFDLNVKHDVHYLLAHDIAKKSIPETVTATICKAHQSYTLPHLTVETLRSTDEGVAFWVGIDGITLYHAGDLNNWRWEGEEESWNRQINGDYLAELKKIKGRSCDIAFLPLDPRLEMWYALGIEGFLQAVQVKELFPMHCWEDFSVIARFQKEHPQIAMHTILADGDTFTIEEF